MNSEQLEPREDELEEARLAVVPAAPRPTPRGSFYLVGAGAGGGFGALIIFAGFWNALLVGGFSLVGLLAGHLARLIADGRIDLGAGWSAMMHRDD